jgi:hypothetical protein
VQIEAEAVVERSERAWHLRLWVRGDETVAEREIEAQTCDALADAAATMLAVAATTPPAMADQPVEIPVPAPSVRQDVQPTPAPVATIREPTTTTPPTTVEPRRRALPPRARIGVLGGVDHGALPGTGGTIVAELGMHWPRVRVNAFGMYGFGRSVAAGDVAARHGYAAGGVSLCGVAPVAAFELGGCAGWELGAIFSEGTRGRALKSARSRWAAGSIGAIAGWRFATRWTLVLRVDAVIPAVRRNFLVGDELVGRIGPVGVRALGGLAVVLP